MKRKYVSHEVIVPRDATAALHIYLSRRLGQVASLFISRSLSLSLSHTHTHHIWAHPSLAPKHNTHTSNDTHTSRKKHIKDPYKHARVHTLYIFLTYTGASTHTPARTHTYTHALPEHNVCASAWGDPSFLVYPADVCVWAWRELYNYALKQQNVRFGTSMRC